MESFKNTYMISAVKSYKRKKNKKKNNIQRIIGAVLRLLHSEPNASSTTPICVNCIYKGK